jgi:hypothetical protein
MTLLFDAVLPALSDRGALTEDARRRILVENPKDWLHRDLSPAGKPAGTAAA